MMTWSVQDPSLSHATSRAIRNILGYPGAIGADLLMQILGLGAIMLILPVAVWGWRMLTHRPFDREALRLGCWILCTVIAAGFASCLPHNAAWPLPTGLGGVVGDALVRAPAVVFGPPGFIYRLVLGMILFAAMAATFLFASGWGSRPREEELTPIEDDDEPFVEEEEDRGSVSLGWLFHALMSAKARLALAVSPAYRSLVVERAAAAALPRSSARSRTSAAARRRRWRRKPEEDEIEEDEDDEGEAPAARAPRKKAAPRRRNAKSSDKFELPSVSVLSAPKATRSPAAQQGRAGSQFARAGRRAAGLRRSRRNRQGQSGPGGHAVRTRARARHQIVARHRPRRRHRALDERALGARRGGRRPQRDRHRTAERAPRKSLFARTAGRAARAPNSVAKLPLCLGKTIGGDPVIIDLARTPHMLIAGTTGSGKSVAINTMILSLVYRLRPDQCRLIMVDPKMLELSVYDGIPHLLTPVVTDPKKAVVALKWAVREMEERYKKMAKLGVRNIDGYNQRLVEARAKGEELTRTVHTGFDKETGKAIYEEEKLDLDPLPYIVIIVDEMADLMMVAGKDIEGAVQRLAQMARAAGLHVILATQRPSVDVITGTIKANFPTRIAFQVTSKIDSRTILGRDGRRATARPGRHALYGGRRPHQPRARTVRVRRRSRESGASSQDAGTAGISGSRHCGRADRRGRRGIRCDRHGRRRRRRFVRASRCDRQARPQGLDLLHSAPPANRL